MQRAKEAPVSPHLSPKNASGPKVTKGPQLPPHLAHLSRGNQDELEPNVIKGPQLPPHLQHLMDQNCEEELTEEKEAEQEQEVTMKGPQLPPHLQHLMNQNDENEPKDASDIRDGQGDSLKRGIAEGDLPLSPSAAKKAKST